MNVELLNTDANYKDAKISAIVTQKNDINGTPLTNEKVHVFEFSPSAATNQFEYKINNLPAGVYNVVINASHDDFIRTVVTGFAIHPNEGTNNIVKTPNLHLSAFPNPIKTTTTIEFELLSDKASFLRVYDAYGRLLMDQNITTMGIGKHTINLNFDTKKWGVGHYFIEVQNDKNKTVLPVVKVQ